MLTRPRTALLSALACLAGLAATGLLAYLSPIAHEHDAASLQGFTGLGSTRGDLVLDRIAHLGDPGSYAVFGLGLVTIALVRGRHRLAALIPVVMVLAPLTAETLKPTLAHPRVAEWLGPSQISAASWPSGHATASMTVALLGVLAAPAVLRPLAAVAGALFTLGVSFSILVLHWHFPSDVVGGYFNAGMWVLLAVAILRRWPEAERARTAERAAQATPMAAAAPALVLGGVAVLLAAAVALDRPRALLDYLAARPSFTISLIAISALAVLLAGVLVRAARGPSV